MSKPMAGVRVVEVAMFAFVPSAGAVLRDWGAEVIKVEHPVTGDPVRGLSAWGVDPGVAGLSTTYLWEIFNRGKRSVGIDIGSDDGREVLLKLVEDADVFLTSFMAPARQRLGIEPEDIFTRNPDIIYGRGTGHGPHGPDADKGGYDAISYWSRSGTSVASSPPDYDFPIPLPGPAFGDTQSGTNLAGGVSAALFERERKGGGGMVVDVSLLGSGLWAAQANIVSARLSGQQVMDAPDRHRPQNPLGNVYRTADGRFLFLGFIGSDRYWPRFCEVIGRSELEHDPRFANEELREQHMKDCVAVLDEVFATRTLEQWREALGAQEGPWTVVATPSEAADDSQAHTNGYVSPVEYPSGAVAPMVVSPAQFDEEAPRLERSPEQGEHTEAVLLEHGYEWADLARLKEVGAIS